MQKYDNLKLRLENTITLRIYFNKSSYVLYPWNSSYMKIKDCITPYKIWNLENV